MDLLKEFQSGERIIRRFKTSRGFYIWEYVLWITAVMYGLILSFATPLAFGMVALGVFSIAMIEVRVHSNQYFLTNKRIMHYYNFLRRRVASLPYSKIKDLHISQRIAERINNLATLHFNGTDFGHIKFRGLNDPIRVKTTIETLMEA